MNQSLDSTAVQSANRKLLAVDQGSVDSVSISGLVKILNMFNHCLIISIIFNHHFYGLLGMILPNARVMFEYVQMVSNARFTSAMQLRSHKDDLYAESKPGWLSWMTTANQTSESTLSSKLCQTQTVLHH